MYRHIFKFLFIFIFCLPSNPGFAFENYLPGGELNFLTKDRLDYIRPPIIYSGKSKVSWKNLKWEKLELPDSDIYYYDRIRAIVPFTAEITEEHDKSMLELFNYDIHKYFETAKEEYFKKFNKEHPDIKKLKAKNDRKNPLMIYGSHQVFEQTNTIYGFIPEGTGGFTEFLKGRVVLPYTGSNKDYVHVLRHEMVHAHNLQKIYQMWKDYDLSGWNARPPLWILEGIAEWGSRCLYLFNQETGKYELDDETKMYLRDATANHLTPPLYRLDYRPGYLNTYKLSQSAVNFMCNHYGKEKFFSIFDNWYRIEGKKTKAALEFWRTGGKKRIDLLNPGVSMYDEPFIITSGRVFDLHKDSDTYSIIRDGEKITQFDEETSVNDLADGSENIQLDDEWFMIHYDTVKQKYMLFNKERGWITKWKKKNVTTTVKNAKKGLLKRSYLLDMNGLLKYCLGDGLKKINNKWQAHNKQLYFSTYGLKEKLKNSDKTTRGSYDRFPVVTKDGRFLLYKSYNKQYYFNLNLFDTKTKKTKRLVHDNTIDIESIHILKAGNDIIKTGENKYSVILSAQNEDSDVIYKIGLKITKNNKVNILKKELMFDFDDHKIIDISMLRFSHDGKHIVFRGVGQNGKADLYTVNLENRKFKRITNDYYDESSPDMRNNTIVFTSDRGSKYLEFNNNVFLLHLDEFNEDGSYRIEQLTSGKREHSSTCFTEKGDVLFDSYEDGYSNIYMIDTDNQLLQLTDLYTGAFNPGLADEKLTFCGYNNGRYNIYQIDYSSLNVVNRGTVNKTLWEKSEAWVMNKEEPSEKRRNYKKKFSMDYVGGGFILSDIEFSANFAGQIYFSDMLGNDIIGVGLLQPGGQVSDINFVLSYTDLSKRFKRSFGAFRIMNYFFQGGAENKLLYEDKLGFYFSRAFPINRSQNINSSIIMNRSSRYDTYLALEGRELYQPLLYLLTLSNSFVHDSTTWAYASPIEGTLMGILLDTTFNISDNGKLLSTALMGDFRHYLRLSRNSCIAMRLGAGQSWGDEPHYFAMGSGLYMRGYEFPGDFMGTKYILMNVELRGLIIDAIKIMIHNHPENPLILGPFQGAIFCDFGYAWSESIPREPSGSLGLAFRFFPVWAPIYISYEMGMVEFWRGGSRQPLSSHLKIRFSF